MLTMGPKVLSRPIFERLSRLPFSNPSKALRLYTSTTSVSTAMTSFPITLKTQGPQSPNFHKACYREHGRGVWSLLANQNESDGTAENCRSRPPSGIGGNLNEFRAGGFITV